MRYFYYLQHIGGKLMFIFINGRKKNARCLFFLRTGLDSAAKLFRRHTRKLKDEFLQRRVESYMDLLPSILREFFPSLRSLENG